MCVWVGGGDNELSRDTAAASSTCCGVDFVAPEKSQRFRVIAPTRAGRGEVSIFFPKTEFFDDFSAAPSRNEHDGCTPVTVENTAGSRAPSPVAPVFGRRQTFYTARLPVPRHRIRRHDPVRRRPVTDFTR